MNVRPAAALFICTTFVALAACGGGGGGGGSLPQPSPQPSPSQGAHLSCSHTFSAARAALSALRIGNLGAHFPESQQETGPSNLLGVQFHGSTISPQAQAALARLGARQLGPLNEFGVATFAIQRADVRTAAVTIGSVPGVAVASPIVFRHKSATIPNDPDYVPDQWDMNQIGMPAVWDSNKGSASVRIAIIDTGYDIGNHDLMGKVDPGKTVVFDQQNGQPHVGASIEDKDGHGSDTSGIAAANTNNLTDVAGTGWGVHLMEARVFPYGSNNAASNDVGAAIDWARMNGANVISLSLGGARDPLEEQAVSRAINAGIAVVAASGNGIKVGNISVGQPTLDYPAADPGVISVGASAYCDQVKGVVGAGGYEYVAGYSNYGGNSFPAVSLVAPGGDPDLAQTNCGTGCTIDPLQWITNLDSLQGQFHEEVSLFAGTSQATPHVAGAVALMLTKDPALTPGQALSILKSTADNISDSHQGSGRLNVLNALNATP